MFSNAIKFIRQRYLLQCHLSLRQLNQAATFDFLIRQFVGDYLINLVDCERLAGVLVMSSLASAFAFLLFALGSWRIGDVG